MLEYLEGGEFMGLCLCGYSSFSIGCDFQVYFGEFAANSVPSLKSLVDGYWSYPSPSLWCALCSNVLKINYDGAYSDSLSFGSAATIMRNCNGIFRDGDAQSFPYPSLIYAEASADGCSHGSELGYWLLPIFGCYQIRS